MWLSGDDIESALLCVSDFVARRRLDSRRVDPAIERLRVRLEAASVDGSENDSGAAQLDVEDLIDSSEAAMILRCSPRWVRDIHADLDGIWIAGRWAFPRQAVVDYGQAREAGCDRNRVSTTRGGAVPPRAR